MVERPSRDLPCSPGRARCRDAARPGRRGRGHPPIGRTSEGRAGTRPASARYSGTRTRPPPTPPRRSKNIGERRGCRRGRLKSRHDCPLVVGRRANTARVAGGRGQVGSRHTVALLGRRRRDGAPPCPCFASKCSDSLTKHRCHTHAPRFTGENRRSVERQETPGTDRRATSKRQHPLVVSSTTTVVRMTALQNRLAGTFHLVSLETRRSDGVVSHPFGEQVVGSFMFDRAGNLPCS